jgi:hypothetical protein
MVGSPYWCSGVVGRDDATAEAFGLDEFEVQHGRQFREEGLSASEGHWLDG